MSEAFFNQWTGTLQADVGVSSLTVTVAPAPKGPGQHDVWRARLGSELAKVTRTFDNGDGTATLTIVRGAEGTTAAAHRKGSSAASVLTAEALQALNAAAATRVMNRGAEANPRVRSVAERLFLASNFS